jgi:hypothetical protein
VENYINSLTFWCSEKTKEVKREIFELRLIWVSYYVSIGALSCLSYSSIRIPRFCSILGCCTCNSDFQPSFPFANIFSLFRQYPSFLNAGGGYGESARLTRELRMRMNRNKNI